MIRPLAADPSLQPQREKQDCGQNSDEQSRQLLIVFPFPAHRQNNNPASRPRTGNFLPSKLLLRHFHPQYLRNLRLKL